MSISELAQWLKGTIAGIVLLGALGSILAALLIWLVKRLLFPLIGHGAKRSLTNLLRHFIAPAASKLVPLYLLPDKDRILKLQAYYALQVMKLSLSLFVGTCGLLFLPIVLMEPAENLFRRGVLLPLIVTFLGFWYAMRCFAMVLVPLYIDLEPIIKKASEEVMAKNKDNR